MITKQIQILLIEDNQGDIDLTIEAFNQAKFLNKINVCMDGSEALQYLKKEAQFSASITPDIILLDINLPKKNGHEVLEAIKLDKNLNHIPVIMLTTSDSPEDIEKSYRNSANSYICKPNNIKELFQTINSFEEFWLSTVQLPNN